jgi:hypothetical protein
LASLNPVFGRDWRDEWPLVSISDPLADEPRGNETVTRPFLPMCNNAESVS